MPITVPSNAIQIDEINAKVISDKAKIVESFPKYSVPYMQWKEEKNLRPVYRIQTSFCKFNINNGRIKMEVVSHNQKL